MRYQLKYQIKDIQYFIVDKTDERSRALAFSQSQFGK